jgi:uncharacterized protein with NAD-binding domain and iron-sulfur cluster
LERSGSGLRVDIVSMEPFVGGRAASRRDAQGYVVDHGFHAVFGFYDEMRSLAQRAGVDLSRALVKSDGVFRYYDARSSRTEEFHFAHNPLVMLWRAAHIPGLGEDERRRLIDGLTRAQRTLARTPNIEALDDICYRAFLLEHGAPASFFKHPLYRQIGELIFSYPHEVSAYIVQRGIELLGHCYYDAVHAFCAGSYTEQLWDPIAHYFERLGGRITTGRKLTRFEHDGGKIVAAHFTGTDGPSSESADTRDGDFAAMICTVPGPCFVELNDGDVLWREPFFARIKQLTWVSSVSLQVWLRASAPRPPPGMVAGLDLPLGYAVDYKAIVPEFTRDTRYGAAIEWVGTEEGWETTPDLELMDAARRSLARVSGFEGTDRLEVVHSTLRRNRASHERYLLTDPGTLRFRPTVRTPLRNLYLAGDWVRNTIDIPTMEGAIVCGKDAANQVLSALH